MLQYCFSFYVSVFWLRSWWDLSSCTRNWTCTPSARRQNLDHWIAREAFDVYWRWCSVKTSMCDYMMKQKVRGLFLKLLVLSFLLDISGDCPPNPPDLEALSLCPLKLIGRNQECQTLWFLHFTQNSPASVFLHVCEHICEKEQVGNVEKKGFDEPS